MAKKYSNHCACEMFVRGGNRSTAPHVTDCLCQRSDHALEQTLRAQFSGRFVQRNFERLRVQRLHCGETIVEIGKVGCRL